VETGLLISSAKHFLAKYTFSYYLQIPISCAFVCKRTDIGLIYNLYINKQLILSCSVINLANLLLLVRQSECVFFSHSKSPDSRFWG
jgi:hypothetical protein